MSTRNPPVIYNEPMAYLNGIDRGKYVKTTFKHVAKHYVMMNHLMTLGMDILLRQEVVRIASPGKKDRVLDAGSGTGDLSRALRKRCPSLENHAADFSLEMMQAVEDWRGIQRCAADALSLPFDSDCFDIALSGYLLRNVGDLNTALSEQYRVLKPGGQIVVLDMTRPRKNLLTPLIKLYFRLVIPALGKLFTGNREAYTYLIKSSENFVSAENLAEAMRSARFRNVTYKIRMFGTMAIHIAVK